MSLKLVELDQLLLANIADNLRLTIDSSAAFAAPIFLAELDHESFVEALISRKFWVTRAANCRFDIEILFNEKPIPEESRLRLLEGLGCGIRDLEMWAHLALAPLLEISNKRSLSSPSPDLSILLKHGTKTLSPRTGPQAWLTNNMDINPPESVPCATFESLQIRLHFTTKSLAMKKIKTVSAKCHEEMLLDYLDNDDYTHRNLKFSITELQGLSTSIANPFNKSHQRIELEPNRQKLFPHFIPDPGSSMIAPSKRGGRKSPPFSKKIIEIMDSGISEHGSETYLNKTERLKFMEASELEKGQVRSPIQRLRGNPPSINEDDVSLSLSSLHDPLSDSEEMLLSPTSESTPSLVSASSISSIVSLKRPFEDSDKVMLDETSSIRVASKLVNIAIHILVAGYHGMKQKRLEGIRVKNTPIKISLATLIPIMFCPGHLGEMAHNARFLPTISSVISTSWPQYAQSPSLRKKLTQLSIETPYPLTSGTKRGSTSGTTAQLSAVVQARIWIMMQTKLYDPASTKKLWQNPTASEIKEDQDTPDLFTSPEEEEETLNGLSNPLGCFEDFKDLFESSEEDDDLLDDEERERLAVEYETDQILLSEDCESEEDLLLLESRSDNENMLL